MDEYISRAKLEFDFMQCNETNSKWTPQRVAQLIHRQPTAEFSVVRNGKWRAFTCPQYRGLDDYGDPIYRDGVVYYCSRCGRRTVIKEKYCPSCGTKMDS